jgi:hypothetical protein
MRALFWAALQAALATVRRARFRRTPPRLFSCTSYGALARGFRARH